MGIPLGRLADIYPRKLVLSLSAGVVGLLIAGLPAWVKHAMENVLRTPDHLLRITGIVSAVGGLLLIWAIRH